MKKLLLLSFFMAAGISAMAQNVGIGTTSPTDQLHTTGTVRFQNLSGTKDRPLMVDTAGRLKVASNAPVFRSNAANSNKTIPDNGCSYGPNAQGARSVISVTNVDTVNPANISIRVNITHTYVGDLKIFLFAPNSQSICIADISSSNSGANLTNTIFADGGMMFPTTATGAPYTGVYAPAGIGSFCNVAGISTNKANFAAFSSTAVNGNWALVVYDKAGQDAGTLVSWELSFGGVEALQQESMLSSNFSIKNSDAEKGKILTALDTAGHATWERPLPYNTAFKAKLTNNVLVSAGSTTTIPFEVSNSGSAYISFDDGLNVDNFTHKYMVPEDGIYLFTVKIDMANNTNVTQSGSYIVRLVSNTNTITPNIYALFSGNLIPNVQFSSLEKLQKGQTVWVEVFYNVGASVVVGSQSHFSGVRLY